jgi:hypothetical protein
MKRILFLACCLALAPPARAATDPFAEFRIPDHSYRIGSVSFFASGSRLHQSAGISTLRSSSLSTSGRGSVSAGWDSDALLYDFGISTSGQLATDHARQQADPSSFSESREEVTNQSREDWRLTASVRSYPWQTPVGLGAQVSARGLYYQDWARTDDHVSTGFPGPQRQDNRQSRASHDYATTVSASLSAGFGRVRDASVVYDVHLLEGRLAETGAITRPLSAQARARLAALYYVTPFFSAPHERPDRFVWREIERVLREDGALGEHGLDPYSVLRAREPYAPGPRPMRQRGYFVGLVGQGASQRQINRMENATDYRLYDADVLISEFSSATSQRVDLGEDQFALGGEAEYHLPLGWRWQVDADVRVTRPARPGESGLNATNDASISWFVADRWQAEASLFYGREYFRPRHGGGALEPPTDSWRTSAGAGIAYFLEDHTSLSLSISETQQRGLDPFYGGTNFLRDGAIQLGMTYRFLGGLDAPGIVEPVRQLH